MAQVACPAVIPPIYSLQCGFYSLVTGKARLGWSRPWWNEVLPTSALYAYIPSGLGRLLNRNGTVKSYPEVMEIKRDALILLSK